MIPFDARATQCFRTVVDIIVTKSPCRFYIVGTKAFIIIFLKKVICLTIRICSKRLLVKVRDPDKVRIKGLYTIPFNS